MRLPMKLLILSCYTSSIFSGFGLGFDSNYLTMSQRAVGTSGATTTADTESLSGFLISPYLRYSIPMGQMFSIGFGPYAGFGILNPTKLKAGLADDTVTYTRLGGEAIITVNAATSVRLFLRAMIGKDYLTETVSLKNGTVTSTVDLKYGGLLCAAMIGFLAPLNDVLGLYFQVGISGSPKSSLSANAVTNDATATTLANTYNASGIQLEYIGINAGAGIAFEF